MLFEIASLLLVFVAYLTILVAFGYAVVMLRDGIYEKDWVFVTGGILIFAFALALMLLLTDALILCLREGYPFFK